jgi:hypothetical protein
VGSGGSAGEGPGWIAPAPFLPSAFAAEQPPPRALSRPLAAVTRCSRACFPPVLCLCPAGSILLQALFFTGSSVDWSQGFLGMVGPPAAAAPLALQPPLPAGRKRDQHVLLPCPTVRCPVPWCWGRQRRSSARRMWVTRSCADPAAPASPCKFNPPGQGLTALAATSLLFLLRFPMWWAVPARLPGLQHQLADAGVRFHAQQQAGPLAVGLRVELAGPAQPVLLARRSACRGGMLPATWLRCIPSGGCCGGGGATVEGGPSEEAYYAGDFSSEERRLGMHTSVLKFVSVSVPSCRHAALASCQAGWRPGTDGWNA